MDIRRWYYLSKSDRRGFAALLLAVFAVGLGFWLYRFDDGADGVPTVSKEEAEELAEFEAEIRRDSSERRRFYEDKFFAVPETFPFDPNTADSFTLVRLGLRSWQAHNVLKYRRKGGRWRSPDDFARLYGLSKQDFLRLKPYIRIHEDERYLRAREEKQRRDSVWKTFPQKLPVGTVLDLNASDTTAFKGIPGIGSYYAQKICRYRERLGGFISAKQIREVEGLPADIEMWVSVEPNAQPFRKIAVNKATFKDLVRHPYLNYEQVKEIVNYIRRNGPLKGWNELRLSPHFSDKDTERLTPYFVFD